MNRKGQFLVELRDRMVKHYQVQPNTPIDDGAQQQTVPKPNLPEYITANIGYTIWVSV